MARIADKLSPSQVERWLKQTRHVAGMAVVSAVIQDEHELVMEVDLEVARADAEFPQTVVDAILDHSQGQGPGLWRYVVQAINADGRMCGSTWARVNVARNRDADGNEEQTLDGSVGSYVQQLQTGIAERDKANAALTRIVLDTLKSQGDMVKTLFERQTSLERERAELIAENLEAAAREALAVPNVTKESEPDDILQQLIKTFGPVVAEKLMDKYGPKLFAALGIDAKSLLGDGEVSSADDAPPVASSAEDAPTRPDPH